MDTPFINTSNATPQDLTILMLLNRLEQLETCLDSLQRDCIMRDILGLHTDYNYVSILFECFQNNVPVDVINGCENIDSLQKNNITKKEFMDLLLTKSIEELDLFWKYLSQINKISLGITSMGYEGHKKITFVRNSKTYFTVE